MKMYRIGLVLASVLLSAGAQAQVKPSRSGQGLAAPAKPPVAAPVATAEATEKETTGRLAAAGWLGVLDQRDWGRAWDTSGTMFRSNVPLGTWIDNIPKVRDPLGALLERAPNNSMYKTTLPGQPAGEYVTVLFDSKFEKKQIQELVTLVREPDGKWRVTGYSPS